MHPILQDLLHFYARNALLAKALMIFIGMFLFHCFSRWTHRVLLAKFDNGKHVWSIAFIKSVHVPWLAFFWVMAITLIIPDIMMHFHIDLSKLHVMSTFRSFAFVIAFYWSLWDLITNMEKQVMPSWARRDQTTVRAVAQLSRVVVVVLLVLSLLPMLGFRTSSLLAFGGVGALGITYAGKDTFSNFIGGMMIFWDRPFSVGDWIRSPDRNIEGNVEHIGWRLTRIRTLDKRPLYIPNSVFSTIAIENPTRMSHRQINMMIGVRYDDAAVITPITQEITALLQQHPALDHSLNNMAHLTELAASSLNINLYAFSKVTDSVKFRQIQQDILLKILAIVSAHGAECAFPTTTVLMPHDDDRSPH